MFFLEFDDFLVDVGSEAIGYQFITKGTWQEVKLQIVCCMVGG